MPPGLFNRARGGPTDPDPRRARAGRRDTRTHGGRAGRRDEGTQEHRYGGEDDPGSRHGSEPPAPRLAASVNFLDGFIDGGVIPIPVSITRFNESAAAAAGRRVRRAAVRAPGGALTSRCDSRYISET